jgi:hypothetical protein
VGAYNTLIHYHNQQWEEVPLPKDVYYSDIDTSGSLIFKGE